MLVLVYIYSSRISRFTAGWPSVPKFASKQLFWSHVYPAVILRSVSEITPPTQGQSVSLALNLPRLLSAIAQTVRALHADSTLLHRSILLSYRQDDRRSILLDLQAVNRTRHEHSIRHMHLVRAGA